MENVINEYKSGSRYAQEKLMDIIQEEYDNIINRDEALVLLYKKYGKVKVF